MLVDKALIFTDPSWRVRQVFILSVRPDEINPTSRKPPVLFSSTSLILKDTNCSSESIQVIFHFLHFETSNYYMYLIGLKLQNNVQKTTFEMTVWHLIRSEECRAKLAIHPSQTPHPKSRGAPISAQYYYCYNTFLTLLVNLFHLTVDNVNAIAGSIKTPPSSTLSRQCR